MRVPRVWDQSHYTGATADPGMHLSPITSDGHCYSSVTLYDENCQLYHGDGRHRMWCRAQEVKHPQYKEGVVYEGRVSVTVLSPWLFWKTRWMVLSIAVSSRSISTRFSPFNTQTNLRSFKITIRHDITPMSPENCAKSIQWSSNNWSGHPGTLIGTQSIIYGMSLN